MACTYSLAHTHRLTWAYKEPSQPRQIPPWRKGYWQEWRETQEATIPPTPPCCSVSVEREREREREKERERKTNRYMSTFTANKPDIKFFKGSECNRFKQHGWKAHSLWTVTCTIQTLPTHTHTVHTDTCTLSSRDQSVLNINSHLCNREAIKAIKLSNYS